MNNTLPPKARAYIEENRQALKDLLVTLAAIPAPSRQEDRRAEFCKSWFDQQGITGAYIDPAKNVVLPYDCQPGKPIIVFMAHMDVVFPDLDALPVRVDDEAGRIYAPGVGDDTSNLCNLLMTARYVAQNSIHSNYGLLFVANTGEEGLGGLVGSRRIIQDFGSRIRYFYSFDGYLGQLVNQAVGSRRYRVTVSTEGGHSYMEYGNRNAIFYLASMIDTLYAMKVPDKAKTTQNVGRIEGGTTVNTIAQTAWMLYEFRSADGECLEIMEAMFQSVVAAYRSMGVTVDVETIDSRPYKQGVDEAALEAFTRRNTEAIARHCGTDAEILAVSTDANMALSVGIVANTIGTVRGEKAHTYEEWIETESLYAGLALAMDIVLGYAENL